MDAILGEGSPFDGVFAVCDALAFGVMEALQSANIAIPEKVRLVGFDGVPASELTTPPLTTIEPDLDQAGRLLVEAVAGDGPHPSVRRVPVRLSVRGSS